jgi:hypothetical protein
VVTPARLLLLASDATIRAARWEFIAGGHHIS